MNTHSLRWVAAREGVKVDVGESRESAEWSVQRAGIEAADLILAAEPGAAEIHGWMPSSQTIAQSFAFLRDHPERYLELAKFQTYTGKNFVLFRQRARE